jgi:hypothetical protein
MATSVATVEAFVIASTMRKADRPLGGNEGWQHANGTLVFQSSVSPMEIIRTEDVCSEQKISHLVHTKTSVSRTAHSSIARMVQTGTRYRSTEPGTERCETHHPREIGLTNVGRVRDINIPTYPSQSLL